MRRKRVAGHVAGIIAVLAVLAWVGNRPGHIPLYDANLVRLAETERQGYCAGVVGWRTGFEGNADQAAECRATHPEESGRVNLTKTVEGFCRAIMDQGWDGWLAACLDIMSTNQYWPTYDGGLTDQWNRARPYPRPALGGQAPQDDGSRTGGRSGGGRPDNPGRSDYGYYSP